MNITAPNIWLEEEAQLYGLKNLDAKSEIGGGKCCKSQQRAPAWTQACTLPPSCKLRQGSTSSTVFLQIYIHVSRRKHSNAWDRKAKKSCTKLLSPEQERRRQQWKAAQVKKRHREAWRHAAGIRRCFEIIFGAGRVQLILEAQNKYTIANT